MLSLPPGLSIWLCTQPTDLRKSFDGLAGLVEQVLGGDPLSGHIFVFRNRASDRVKLLIWDGDGYVIYYKRLEQGTFRFPTTNGVKVTLRATELLMLLDGVDLASVKRLPRYRRPEATPAPAARSAAV